MDLMQPFTDPAMVAGYVAGTPRKVPGFADLHRMAMLLLAERAPEAADILVVGAGGGLELKALGAAQARWRFVGIDPSADMLDLARRVLGPLQSRVVLQQGYVEDAPAGPFGPNNSILDNCHVRVSFWLAITPALPEPAAQAARAKAGERYEAFVAALGRRLAKGTTLAHEVSEDSGVYKA